MKNPNLIEELLKSEELPEVTSPSLGKIELTPSPEILEKNRTKPSSTEPDGSERRQFTRIDVLDQQLELKFSNDLQFAKQYIENISLGGLFVKTTQKYAMETSVPIEFAIPSPSGQPTVFRLKGKVCRVTPQGVGLEFTNLTNEMRQQLEDFVRSVLPKGASLQSKAKAASVDRLTKIREEKSIKVRKTRRLALHTTIVALLLLLNFFAYQELKLTSEATDSHRRVEKLILGGQVVDRGDIRALSRSSDGSFMVFLEDGTQLQLTKDQLEKELPYDLRVDLHVLSTLPTLKPRRTSQTSQTIQLAH